MSFFDQIFGTEMPLAARFIIAFAVVLGLIALTAWLLRQFAGKRLPLPANGRGRQPRLGVLDAFAVDARRRLVLIRRDNVEHLIMIGGPNDLVVESQIIRAPIGQGAPVPGGAMTPRQQQAAQRSPQVPPTAAAPAAPIPAAPVAAAAIPGPLPTPEPEARPQAPVPPPAAAPRAPIPAAAAPASASAPAAPTPRPAEPRAAPPAFGDPARTTNFYRAIMNREPGHTDEKPLPASERVAAERRAAEPAPEAARPAAPAPKRGDVDPLFADIERKLDEALKRPAPSFGRNEPRHAEPAARPEAPQRAQPHPEPETAGASRAAQSAPAPAGGEAPKTALDALEEEMVSLLGRGFDRDDR